MVDKKTGQGLSSSGLPLLELATAYNSLRDSGFDFPTAVGELIDNSIQANANQIDIVITTEKKKAQTEVIVRVAVVDNGDGMDLAIAHGCLQLGFSTRYGDRTGIGRFGVGATLAAISQCKRISLFSRQAGNTDFLSTHIDIDDIANESQSEIPMPDNLMPPDDLMPFVSEKGTVVLWEKCDRLEDNLAGRPLPANGLIDALKNWLARAYRHYLWDGIIIRLNGEPLSAHDPLYLKPDKSLFPNDEPAEVRFDHTLEWEIPRSGGKKSGVKIILTLLPKSVRPSQGSGGAEPAIERRIDENEGISILRHKREVGFGNFYPMVPAVDTKDRWWGGEIHFEPVLDECWEVKNVKRGARPIPRLRDAIGKLIRKHIMSFREEVSTDWRTAEAEKADEKGIHATPEEIVERVEIVMKPSTQAAKELSKSEKETKKKDLIESLDLPEKVRKALEEKINVHLPISIETKAFAGAEFIETKHIGDGQMVITFNKNHPFFSDVYERLEEIERGEDSVLADVAMEIRYAVDLLLMAYGRAESMIDLNNHIIDEAVTELKSYWGVQLRKYINELKRS